jgi:Zn finger protein HypA/HybF involved in hydrogenase expression
MTKPMIKKVCEKCGSEDIWIDAAAEWDIDSQSWQLGNMWDYSHCADCDSKTDIVDQEIKQETDQ